MLAGLWHWAIGCTYNNNSTIHLRRTRDHVLDIVSMARAVHVRIMPVFSLILHVRDSNGDAAFFFLWCFVDLIKRNVISKTFLRQNFGDGGCQSRLAMVNVTNRSYI